MLRVFSPRKVILVEYLQSQYGIKVPEIQKDRLDLASCRGPGTRSASDQRTNHWPIAPALTFVLSEEQKVNTIIRHYIINTQAGDFYTHIMTTTRVIRSSMTGTILKNITTAPLVCFELKPIRPMIANPLITAMYDLQLDRVTMVIILQHDDSMIPIYLRDRTATFWLMMSQESHLDGFSLQLCGHTGHASVNGPPLFTFRAETRQAFVQIRSRPSALEYLFTPSSVQPASDRILEMDVWPPRNGVKRPRPISLRRLTHQPIKLSSMDHLATFTRFWSRTRKGKFVWIHNKS